jgi:anti-sigma B factor antagonist
MPEHAYPVQWTGRYAVMTFPQDIDGSNAGQIREQLLWLINRGAAVLVADLTGTVYCDHGGADALGRAYVCAVENGTELRLVVAAYGVRRVLRSSGLDRIIPVYTDLEAAVPALPWHREACGEQRSGTADRAALAGKLLDSVVSSIFNVGLALQGGTNSPDRMAAQRITEALCRLDDVVREVRDHVFAEHGRGTQADLAWAPPPSVLERSAGAMNRAAVLQQRLVQTARALQCAATDTVALLEQQADLVGLPSRIDYPADIKRFRALADQAREIAERWDQQP